MTMSASLFTPFRALFVASIFLLGRSLLAAPPDFETVLIPISYLTPVVGAYGSVWVSDFTLLAKNGEVVLALTQECLACGPVIRVSPGFTISGVSPGRAGDPPGELIYPSRATVDNAWFELRIRDVSRSADDWGTELPVVRERDFFSSELVLVDVPLDARFRQALRIYDVANRSDTIFHVTITDLRGEVLAERDLQVRAAPANVPEAPRAPSVVEVTDLRAAFPEIAMADRAVITITPVNTGVRFWAFVSVTNNSTQHVTTVTPQH